VKEEAKRIDVRAMENAKNLPVIRDVKLASLYLKNW
jgi:hypothetical protein